MGRALAPLLALLCLAACEAPSQHDEARWGVRAVTWSADDWPSSHRDVLAAAVADESRLGPTVRFVASRAVDARAILFAHWKSPDCARVAEWWDAATNTCWIDPVCADGFLAFAYFALHCYGHAQGMAHVCRRPGELPECSSVGYGAAAMNAGVVDGVDTGPGPGEAYTGPVPQVQYTELDLAEFRRVHP